MFCLCIWQAPSAFVSISAAALFTHAPGRGRQAVQQQAKEAAHLKRKTECASSKRRRLRRVDKDSREKVFEESQEELDVRGTYATKAANEEKETVIDIIWLAPHSSWLLIRTRPPIVENATATYRESVCFPFMLQTHPSPPS